MTLRTNGWLHLSFPERFDARAAGVFGPLYDQIISDARDCLLNMEDCRAVDAAGLGVLARLQKELRKQGRTMILMSVRPAVKRTLQFMGLFEFFTVAEDMQSARQAREALDTERAFPVGGSRPLVLQGEITVENAGEILKNTERRCASDPSCDIEIDVSKVRFIDSTGAAMLRDLHSALESNGRRLVLRGAAPAMRNVLGFCRLGNLILAGTRPEFNRSKRDEPFMLSRQSAT